MQRIECTATLQSVSRLHALRTRGRGFMRVTRWLASCLKPMPWRPILMRLGGRRCLRQSAERLSQAAKRVSLIANRWIARCDYLPTPAPCGPTLDGGHSAGIPRADVTGTSRPRPMKPMPGPDATTWPAALDRPADRTEWPQAAADPQPLNDAQIEQVLDALDERLALLLLRTYGI